MNTIQEIKIPESTIDLSDEELEIIQGALNRSGFQNECSDRRIIKIFLPTWDDKICACICRTKYEWHWWVILDERWWMFFTDREKGVMYKRTLIDCIQNLPLYEKNFPS